MFAQWAYFEMFTGTVMVTRDFRAPKATKQKVNPRHRTVARSTLTLAPSFESAYKKSGASNSKP